MLSPPGMLVHPELPWPVRLQPGCSPDHTTLRPLSSVAGRSVPPVSLANEMLDQLRHRGEARALASGDGVFELWPRGSMYMSSREDGLVGTASLLGKRAGPESLTPAAHAVNSGLVRPLPTALNEAMLRGEPDEFLWLLFELLDPALKNPNCKEVLLLTNETLVKACPWSNSGNNAVAAAVVLGVPAADFKRFIVESEKIFTDQGEIMNRVATPAPSWVKFLHAAATVPFLCQYIKQGARCFLRCGPHCEDDACRHVVARRPPLQCGSL